MTNPLNRLFDAKRAGNSICFFHSDVVFQRFLLAKKYYASMVIERDKQEFLSLGQNAKIELEFVIKIATNANYTTNSHYADLARYWKYHALVAMQLQDHFLAAIAIVKSFENKFKATLKSKPATFTRSDTSYGSLKKLFDDNLMLCPQGVQISVCRAVFEMIQRVKEFFDYNVPQEIRQNLYEIGKKFDYLKCWLNNQECLSNETLKKSSEFEADRADISKQDSAILSP